MEVDHEKLARELIRSLRGARSQVQFSRRLGFAANTVYSWESGRRWPSATRFFFAAQRTGLHLPAVLAPFYKRVPTWLGDGPGSRVWLVKLLCDLRGDTPIRTLSERTGHSRFALSRWLSGRAEPSLPGLLRFVDAATLRLLDFVTLFVPPTKLPSIGPAWARLQSARELAWGSPWTPAVLLALELEDYRALPEHDSAWIAQRLGVEIETVDDSLRRLLAAGHVRFEGAHHQPTEILALDMRGPRTGSDLKRHWAQVARERLGSPDAIASYNLFTVSHADLEELRELQRNYVRSVRTLVAQSSPADRLVLMNLQLVALDEP